MLFHRGQDRHSHGHHGGQEGKDRAKVMVGLVKCVNKDSGIEKDLQPTMRLQLTTLNMTTYFIASSIRGNFPGIGINQ